MSTITSYFSRTRPSSGREDTEGSGGGGGRGGTLKRRPMGRTGFGAPKPRAGGGGGAPKRLKKTTGGYDEPRFGRAAAAAGGDSSGGDIGMRAEYGVHEAMRAKKKVMHATLRTLSDPAQNLRYQHAYTRFECVAKLVRVDAQPHQMLLTFDDSTAVAVMNADPSAVSALRLAVASGDSDDGSAADATNLPCATEPDESGGGGGGGGRGDEDGGAGDSGGGGGGGGGADRPTVAAVDEEDDEKTRAARGEIPLNVYYTVFGEIVPRTGTLGVRVMRRVTDPNRFMYAAVASLKEHLLWLRSPEYAMNRSASVRVDTTPQKNLPSLDSYRRHQTFDALHSSSSSSSSASLAPTQPLSALSDTIAEPTAPTPKPVASPVVAKKRTLRPPPPVSLSLLSFPPEPT